MTRSQDVRTVRVAGICVYSHRWPCDLYNAVQYPAGLSQLTPHVAKGGSLCPQNGEGFGGFSSMARTYPEVTVSGDLPFQPGTPGSIRYVSSHRNHSQISVKTTGAHLAFVPTHNERYFNGVGETCIKYRQEPLRESLQATYKAERQSVLFKTCFVLSRGST